AELTAGRGEVDLPYTLRAKMPDAAATLPWQYLFPASRPCAAPTTGRPVLHHLHESAVQKAVQEAARAAQLDKRANCHTLRHGFATHCAVPRWTRGILAFRPTLREGSPVSGGTRRRRGAASP